LIRLYLVAEGETEEDFAKDVLAPHLHNFSVHIIVLPLGGISSFGKIDYLVKTQLKQDQGSFLTTMIDLYRLPKDFPGFQAMTSVGTGAQKADQVANAWRLELAMGRDNLLASLVGRGRFIPYIQVHEFEALLFSKPLCIAELLAEYHDGLAQLLDVTDKFQSPEDIDGGPETAPSKRLKAIYGKVYEKRLYGTLIAQDIGLQTIRAKCPHFSAWVAVLERLKA